MITIKITEEANNYHDLVLVLQRIIEIIEEGNTSGIDPTFILEGEEETL